MSETKCKKCHSFAMWLELPTGWVLFDYGKKRATPENPLTSEDGYEITTGLGFRKHSETCADRIRKKLIQAKKDSRLRDNRKQRVYGKTTDN